jgi:hypothetical protein
MNNSLSKDQFKKLLKDKKILIPILVLILLNIKIFILNIKFNIKSKNDPYKVENMINILSKFKPHINCKENIYVYMKEPKDIVHSNYAFHYSLSPCQIIYEGESKFQVKKGFSFINKLHPDFSLSNDKIIYSTSDFKLIKN